MKQTRPERAPKISSTCRILLDEAGVREFHSVLDDFWQRLVIAIPERVSAEWTFSFGIALGELLANSARHAYSDSSASGRWLALNIEGTGEGVRAEIRDGGEPFQENKARHLDEDDIEDIADLSESGRGLDIVRITTDHFSYTRTDDGENVWNIGKDFSVA